MYLCRSNMKTDPRNIEIQAYDYPLPDERIARHPLAQRDACKLLCYAPGRPVADHVFSELPALLPKGTMLVYNNTRVINARLHFTKETGASIEIFCLEPAEPADYAQSFASTGSCSWNCLIGNSKRWKEGVLRRSLTIGAHTFELRAVRLTAPGVPAQQVRLEWDCPEVSLSEIIAAVGEIPIPPYLNRESEDSDSRDYQTVYSHIEGSVAAPTAGLHFTPELLAELDRSGVERREVTLHVGAGTFRPVATDTIGGHDMHSEFIAVERDFIADLADALDTGCPVTAVGTTSVRTLESLYHIGVLVAAGDWTGELPQWMPYDRPSDMPASEALRALAAYLDAAGVAVLVARTRIIIAPGYRYRIVDAMITNFHQPASTLLLLVSAFIGPEWRAVYDHALDNGYRFLSYGDACFFSRKKITKI